MGYGEDYIYRFGDWLDTLSPEERVEYRALFPEPVTWKGRWDDEDKSKLLEHGDFFVEAWRAGVDSACGGFRGGGRRVVGL